MEFFFTKIENLRLTPQALQISICNLPQVGSSSLFSQFNKRRRTTQKLLWTNIFHCSAVYLSICNVTMISVIYHRLNN